MATWLQLDRDGVRLACRDFGGDGPAVMLLHGLAGHADEWAETAGWLTHRCRVVGLDARGHGRSERFPLDVSQAAYVSDVVFALAQLTLGQVILIGQSLGGVTALLVAAEHPDVVRGLVLADASPAQDHPAVEREISDALTSWPTPFPTQDAALEFFGGQGLRAEAWVAGLEQRQGGLWPRFEVEVLIRTLREANQRDYWREWQRIQCPTLVMCAGNGIISAADAQSMVEQLPQARLVELAGAEHDLHLDRPTEWRATVNDFLGSLGIE